MVILVTEALELMREIARLHFISCLLNVCIMEVWRILSREKRSVITLLLYDLINSQISNIETMHRKWA